MAYATVEEAERLAGLVTDEVTGRSLLDFCRANANVKLCNTHLSILAGWVGKARKEKQIAS